MPRRRRRQQGESPVWDWIKKAAKNFHGFVKDNKLISRGAASLAPIAGPYSGTVNRIGNVASALGYGRRKKPGRKRKGRKKK